MSRMHPGKPPSWRARPGDDWREKARKATDMVIAITRHPQSGEPEAIRPVVLGHAREALGHKETAEFMSVMNPDLGEGPGPTEVMTMPGIFRLVFENSPLDRSSESSVETFMAEVQRRLDEVLANPDSLDAITRGPRKS